MPSFSKTDSWFQSHFVKYQLFLFQVPLPGYAEAFPHPRYPQGSPLLWKHSQGMSPQGAPEQPPSPSTAASQQSLTDPGDLISPDTPLSSLSTSALVKAIRDEVAKLAKKQADMFEFQV